ncbi:MAG: ribosomal RNA small subunit methyltransferase A [Candidatus Pelagibacter sp. TMED273]|nr:MAG: ribosomal RNA small subunit methyltransferase A [Candidatus Pelagibacter sp. TMED273]
MQIKAKKSLGQNFLIDKNIINKIVEKANIKFEDTILEIGPGTGNLTEFILKKKPKKIYVIEKDTNLSSYLYKKFEKKLIIINKDFLNIKISDFKEKLIIFGNLPYNISTQILIKLIKLEDKELPYKELIFMFQKEVAQRILAQKDSKDFGRLSIISGWRLNVEKMFDINPSCFYPKPKVTSTLIKFMPKKNYFKFNNYENLEKITNVFFNQRRKKIKSAFKKLFRNPEYISKKLKIDNNLRPENLSPEEYYEITREYESLNG